jgi:hypothetical protein
MRIIAILAVATQLLGPYFPVALADDASWPFQKRCIAEIATATWCGFCSIAERGMQEMETQHDPSLLSIYAHHYKDSLQTTGGLARLDRYGATVTPIVIFNGQTYYVGGDNKAKSEYKRNIDEQLAKKSPFLAHLAGSVEGTKLKLNAWVLPWTNLPEDINYTFIIGRKHEKTAGGDYYLWVTKACLPKATGEHIEMAEKLVTQFSLSYDIGKIDPSEIYASFVLESFAKRNIYQVATWKPNCLSVQSTEPQLGSTQKKAPEVLKITFQEGIQIDRTGNFYFKNVKGDKIEATITAKSNTVEIKPTKTLPNDEYLVVFETGIGKTKIGNLWNYALSPVFLFFWVKDFSSQDPPPPPPPPPDPPKPPEPPPPPKPAKLAVDKLGFDLGEVMRDKTQKFSFIVSNEGEEKFTGKIKSDSATLTFTPDSFEITPTTIECTLNPISLKPGVTHSLSIIVETSAGNVAIGVKFTIPLLPPSVYVEPTTLDFGKNLDQKLSFTIKNSGECELLGKVSTDTLWLQLATEQILAGSQVSVSIIKQSFPKLTPGEHAIKGEILVDTNGGKLIIPVSAMIVVEKPIVVIELLIGAKYGIVNGMPVELLAPPKLKNGRVFVPMRFIVESFGGEAFWDQQTKSTRIKFASKKIEISMKVNEAKIEVVKQGAKETRILDVPPFVENGVTFVPLRFFSDVLGAKTEWFSAEKRVKITYEP